VLGQIDLYWHTVRHLRPCQIYHQIRRNLLPPKLVTALGDKPDPQKFELIPWIGRQKSFLGNGRFLFLNKEYDLGWPINWEISGCSHLWQYNLHYFDYLHQVDIDRSEGLALIRSWIEGHPVQNGGVGWEPYPVSLRIVNWIKFLSGDVSPPDDVINSLLSQAINLENMVEYHLLGNHLWANAKTLCFAGAFLGKESLERLGRKIVLRELSAQFLPGGGHFELSPMYHSILLEDILDLSNLYQAISKPSNVEILSPLQKAAEKAMAWLAGMVDEEGKIPLLNDSVYGVASSWAELRSYAERLGVNPCFDCISEVEMGGWLKRNYSGYWVVRKEPLRLIFDTAPLGPDYLPGHGHCDMLAVLLDFEGQNIFTDTGVFEYEEGENRRYVRGTSAHNTVVLDDLEQAELWKSFRVGRRGHPQGFKAEGQDLQCSHNGFSIWQKGLFHERTVSLMDNGVELKDHVKGPGTHNFKAFFHFAPGVHIKEEAGGYRVNRRLFLEPWGAETQLKESHYYPEFGVIQDRPCLVLSGRFSGSAVFGLRCTYSS